MKTTATILAVLLTACGPEPIGLGEGETSSETGDGEPIYGDEPGDGGGMFCIEDHPSASCWVPWGADSARVMLGCEIDTGELLGAFGPAYEDDLEPWGPVTCHEVISTDTSVCFFGTSNVVIARDAGEWGPIVSGTAADGTPADPPC